MDIDVKELRKALKLTQKELANKLDVDVITVNRWECKQIRPHRASIKKMRRLLSKVAK